MTKNILVGFLFLLTGNVSSVQAAAHADKPYSTAEYAECVAGIAKFPANLYKGRYAQEIKWASRAAHAGLAWHNKPDDRQHHNQFWLFWSLVNLSSLLVERASSLPIFSGASEEESEDAQIAALEQLEKIDRKSVV